MKNNLFKIIWTISFIVQLIIFILVGFVYKNTYVIYNDIYYVALSIIEIINILFGILIFKKSNKLINILYVVFALIVIFIPVYHNANTEAPKGPNSEFMGLAINERYLDAYGINIKKIIDKVK